MPYYAASELHGCSLSRESQTTTTKELCIGLKGNRPTTVLEGGDDDVGVDQLVRHVSTASYAEKTWQAPQMAARLLSVLPTYTKYPNRPIRSAGSRYAMFEIEDAQVQEKLAKMLHGLSSAG